MARAGVEPATSRFSGERSYQLSYLAVQHGKRTVGPTRICQAVQLRLEVAAEEAEAAEAEVAENAATLDVPLHVRISRDLDAELRRRAAAEQIPTSALVRRLLAQAVQRRGSNELTEADVEEIARRVSREELHTAGQ